MSRSSTSRFLSVFEQEHAKTVNVLRAFPADKTDFTPHERSNTAFALGWTFVVEEQLILLALKHELRLGGGFPKPPDTWLEVLAAFDKVHAEVVAALQDPKAFDGTVTFFVAPKQTGEFALEEFAWFMLHDQIHHRGQLSVYVRMAGGKVPSIYGPSADEPWT